MPERSAEALKGQLSILIMAVCTPHRRLGTTAPSLVCVNPWEQWERVRIEALAESFNATLKREVLRDRKLFESPISCRQEIFRWCMRYNTRRRHSWCNLLAPDDFDALNSAKLPQAA